VRIGADGQCHPVAMVHDRRARAAANVEQRRAAGERLPEKIDETSERTAHGRVSWHERRARGTIAAMNALLTFFRGLRALRHPALVRRLGDLLAREQEIDAVRRRNPGTHISSDAVIDGWREGTLRLGAGVTVERGTLLNLGDPHNGFGTLDVGEGTWIGQYDNLRLSGGTTIRIGARCLISQFCTIVAANHSIARGVRIADARPADSPRDVTIGDDVWLGAGVIVLPGVTIADGAVIGAGSVVTESVGAYEIRAGNPARTIGVRPE